MTRVRVTTLPVMAVPVIAALLVAACTTSAPPATVEYLLRPSLQETSDLPAQSAGVAVGRVSIASYLERSGVVVETTNQRIQAARDHVWAEPLSRSVRRILQVEIGRALGRGVLDTQAAAGQGDVVVDVNVHRLHGSLEGTVVLAADWQLRDVGTGAILGRHELVRTTLTEEAGYDALVRAHVTLLEQLAEAIAETISAAEASSA